MLLSNHTKFELDQIKTWRERLLAVLFFSIPLILKLGQGPKSWPPSARQVDTHSSSYGRIFHANQNIHYQTCDNWEACNLKAPQFQDFSEKFQLPVLVINHQNKWLHFTLSIYHRQHEKTLTAKANIYTAKQHLNSSLTNHLTIFYVHDLQNRKETGNSW